MQEIKKKLKNLWYEFIAWVIIITVLSLVIGFAVLIYWLDHLRFNI